MLNINLNQHGAYLQENRTLQNVGSSILSELEAAQTSEQAQIIDLDDISGSVAKAIEKHGYINPGGDNVKEGVLVQMGDLVLFKTRPTVVPLHLPGHMILNEEVADMTYNEKLHSSDFANVIIPSMLVLKSQGKLFFGVIRDYSDPNIEHESGSSSNTYPRWSSPFTNMWSDAIILGANDKHGYVGTTSLNHSVCEYEMWMRSIFSDFDQDDPIKKEAQQAVDHLTDLSEWHLIRKEFSIVTVLDLLLEQHFPKLSQCVVKLHGACFEDNALHAMRTHLKSGFIQGLTSPRNDDLDIYSHTPRKLYQSSRLLKSLAAYFSENKALGWVGSNVRILTKSGEIHTLPERNSEVLYTMIKAYHALDNSGDIVFPFRWNEDDISFKSQSHKDTYFTSIKNLLTDAPSSIAWYEFDTRSFSTCAAGYEDSTYARKGIVGMMERYASSRFCTADSYPYPSDYSLTYTGAMGGLSTNASPASMAFLTLIFETLSMLEPKLCEAIMNISTYRLAD